MAGAPEISCVIPAYQSVPLLSRCLMSIVTQVGVAAEVIVVDDSTSGEVRAFVESLRTLYPRIGYFPGARTGNPVDNWNAGLDRATGRYCVLVHHDEFLFDAGYLRRAVDALQSSGAVMLTAGHASAGQPASSRAALALRLARTFRLGPWSLYLINWIGPTAAVVFEAARRLRFDPGLVWLVDVDFYARLLSGGGVRISDDEISVISMRHNKQITARIDSRVLKLQELLRLSRTAPERLTRWRYRAAILFAALFIAPWRWFGHGTSARN